MCMRESDKFRVAARVLTNESFVRSDTSVTSFEFVFDFDNLVDESLSVHLFFDFNEVVVDSEKIDDERIVNVNEIIHKMKIHLSFSKSIVTVNRDQFVIVDAKFDDKVVNINENLQSDWSKSDVNFDYTKIVFFDVFVLQFNNHLKACFFLLNELSSLSIKSTENEIFDDSLFCDLDSSKIWIDNDDDDDLNTSDYLSCIIRIILEKSERIADENDSKYIVESRLKVMTLLKLESFFEKVVSTADECEEENFESHCD